mmetsp:Transcript_4347/g.5007  ORF Transcript_4347/g.5007 Transcript_4347/m.5007 type:complete len:105 (+) Transcript_4347:262-576(+)
MSSGNHADERVNVTIRMRPLNQKEAKTTGKVWRVLKKHNVVAQTSPAGKSLSDITEGRNFFKYDETFSEASTTKEIIINYNDIHTLLTARSLSLIINEVQVKTV